MMWSRVGLWLILLLAPMVYAHDWAELHREPLNAVNLEKFITRIEQEQRQLPKTIPPLAKEANLMLDWLKWLEQAQKLDTMQGQAALSKRLQDYGYPYESDLVVDAWQHDLEHLANAYDALTSQQNNPAPATIEQLNQLPSIDTQTAQILSYRLALSNVLKPAERQILEPFMPRLAQLIKNAQAPR